MGAKKEHSVVKTVGGAQILDPKGVFNIGKRNYLAMRKIFWKNNVAIAAEHVGGEINRTVRLGDGFRQSNCEDGDMELENRNLRRWDRRSSDHRRPPAAARKRPWDRRPGSRLKPAAAAGRELVEADPAKTPAK